MNRTDFSSVCMQADFSFFFDTGGRRRCYVAPERFYDPEAADDFRAARSSLQASMVRIFRLSLEVICPEHLRSKLPHCRTFFHWDVSLPSSSWMANASST